MVGREIKHENERKYPRVSPERDVYAVFGEEKNVIGKLYDISMGGLSCRYYTNSEDRNEYSTLDLFTPENDVYMRRVPCSVVYTVSLNNTAELNMNMAVQSRRVGVKFEELTYIHQNQLKALVENTTPMD